MKIKFCGIRRMEDVAFCNTLKPDYMGMILSEGFRRTVPLETARKLSESRKPGIAAVGVFVNASPVQIAEVLRQVPLDVIQLHGSETAEIVSGVRWRTGLPVWKAVRVKAGGLTPENVVQAAETVHTTGVDFSSGIETGGIKDYEKMEQIIRLIRGGNHG